MQNNANGNRQAMRLLLFFFIIIGLLLYLDKEEDSPTEAIARGPAGLVQVEKLDAWRLALPSAEQQGSLPFLLIFGGISYANPDFMLANCPSIILEQAVVGIFPCRYMSGPGGEEALRQFLAAAEQRGLKPNRLSVAAFSGGAADALEIESQQIYSLLLIDPEPKLPKSGQFSAKYTILGFNKNNWLGNKAYGEATGFAAFDSLAAKVSEAGGMVEELDKEHKDFPTYLLFKHRFYL